MRCLIVKVNDTEEGDGGEIISAEYIGPSKGAFTMVFSGQHKGHEAANGSSDLRMHQAVRNSA
jgi:hypothetical protein